VQDRVRARDLRMRNDDVVRVGATDALVSRLSRTADRDLADELERFRAQEAKKEK